MSPNAQLVTPDDPGISRDSTEESPVPSEPEAKRRKPGVPRAFKSFMGCITCRSRKVRCDLGRPFCANCQKLKLECSGYGVHLVWLAGTKFTPSGSIVPSLGVFRRENQVDGTSGGGESRGGSGLGANSRTGSPVPEKYSMRRLMDFVDWEKVPHFRPYDTYDRMDQDLAILHNSSGDSMVQRGRKTKLLGPFGVFQAGDKSNGKEKSSNKVKVTKLTNSTTNTTTNTTNSTTTNANTTSTNTNNSDPHSHHHTHTTTNTNTGPPTTYTPPVDRQPTPTLAPLADAVDSISNEHLWLSNELRDDALLTAAALNGDSHLLDFTNLLYPQYPGPTSQNEFLNLLFHKNVEPTSAANASAASASAPASTATATATATAPAPTANAPNASAPHIGPADHHLYYSNYNNYFYDNPYKLNESLDIHLHASTNPALEQQSTDSIDGQLHTVTKMPLSIMQIVQSPLQPKLGFNPQTPASSVELPSSALQIQPLTRYLLNYYVTHVADLMTVLPLTESPWKTIYFPRALMAIGELSALGKTSTAKNALLNALLAVSAFNLQSKFAKNSDSMKFYLNLGIRLRNQASLFIRQLLGTAGGHDRRRQIETCLNNEKYKDVLCAVMSMISVDLVWGTMQDTNFYIKWCGEVITTKMKTKKKLSSKARVLHRIFLSLKIIQDSTCLDMKNIEGDYEDIDKKGYNVNGEASAGDAKNSSSTPPAGDGAQATPLFINKKLINTKNHSENFATDALYGIPNSLILLFAQTVRLLRRKLHHEHNKLQPPNFDEDVTALGNRLQNWSLDWNLYIESKGQKQFYSPMHEVTYHHILSFYNGLTIYFNRLIKNVSASEIQDKVELTLLHLNSIHQLIVKEDVAIIPLFWQGFIAGCEAILVDLQLGYKKWGADIAQYLGSYWGARQIMLEVWRRKRLHLADDSWVGVIGDWEMNLMLN